MSSKARPKLKKKQAKRKPPLSKVAKKQIPAQPAEKTIPSGGYEDHRKKMAERSRERAEQGIDIGDIPAVVDPKRKEACRLNLQLACETYWRDRFPLPWSQDQIDALKKIQEVVLEGGQFAFAMYRGGGKTTICETAAEWAELYGHRKFCVLIGATGEAATHILDSIQGDLETNDLLLEDFPEVCYPVRRLEGESRRCARQTHHGERTGIEWSSDNVVFPKIEGSPAAGAVIHVVGMTGRIRGLKRGKLRPDLLLIDDPQTDESAASPIGNNKRKRIIQRAALKLAGPDKMIACMMPCTIIAPGDMVDQFTDRQLHPEWNGERRRLVHAFPKNKQLWDQYQEMRADGLRAGRGEKEATEFYLANRAAMDDGAVIAWPEFTKGKASAIQYVMDEFADDPDGAAAELNNDPRKDDIVADVRQIEESDIVAKLNTIKRGFVPRDLNKLTAFIDIQQEILFWAVCGWNDRFGGALIDYGTFPQQRQTLFTAGRPSPSLSEIFPRHEMTARIYSGLEQLVPWLLGRSFEQHDANGALSVSMCLIDTGFKPDAVHDFISRSALKGLLHGSKGRGISESAKPMNDYRKDPGDKMGWNWRIDAKTTAKGRIVVYDTYSWKTFVAEGILAPAGSQAAFYLPGEKVGEHSLLAMHLLSEYRSPVRSEITGRRVEKWLKRPGEYENHWWDCVVGAAVAASIQGVEHSPSGQPLQQAAAAKPLKLSELQKKKQAAGR